MKTLPALLLIASLLPSSRDAALAERADGSSDGAAPSGTTWAGLIRVDEPTSGGRVVYAVRLTDAGRHRLRTTSLEVLESRPPESPSLDGASERCPFDPLRYYNCAFDRCLSGAGRCLESAETASACFDRSCRDAFAACFGEAFRCRPPARRGNP